MTSSRRTRPLKARSTKATPGGDTVTAPQDLEAEEGAGRNDDAVTRPNDVEPEDGRGGRALPDDAAGTEPADLEPAERKRPSDDA